MRFFSSLVIAASLAFWQTPGLKDCAGDGTVVNAVTGSPIQHAQVGAADEHGASTDAAGKWSITGIPCGAARFTVSHAGFLEITYGPRPAAHDVRIQLTPEAAIFGKVLDEAGDPIA